MGKNMISHFHHIGKTVSAGLLTLLLCASALFPLTALTGCAKKAPQPETRTAFFLNTVVSITLYEKEPDALFDHCMDLLASYENMLSRTKENSDIWKINHSGGAAVTLQPETAELLSIALSYAEMSGGVVDPTVGTLTSLWNFGDDNQGIVPSDAEILEALSHVNYRNVVLEGNTVTLKDPDTMLDLGFIAKGYIADRLKEYLVSCQVKSAVISLGGNVLTIGSRPNGTPFQIGIQKPFAERGTAALVLSVTDKSLVSSGNYERYFIKDDILYHHILSTENGYPSGSGLSSVTIISKSSVEGDVLSTLCFLLGYEKGKELTDSLQDVEAVFIDTNGIVL